MRTLKICVVTLFMAAIALSTTSRFTVKSQTSADELGSPGATAATEAPAGFDNKTNGLVAQGTPPAPGADPVPGTFVNDKLVFEEVDLIADGLGPVYNAQACSECHQNPVTGGISQITELRAGHNDAAGNFVEAAGGSLINDRATNASIQEVVKGAETIRTFRTSLNVLGDGFVEAIANATLVNIANGQPGQSGGAISGRIIYVPVLESPGQTRVGRFGWKNQQASLLSFASDAYLNEQGITNRLNLVENTSLGRSIAAFDPVADNTPCEDDPAEICGEDPEQDIEIFARFMRSTKAPPRDTAIANSADGVAGSNLFNQVGCNICHVRSITTAPAGTIINGGAFRIPTALGNKVIHPFGDFLMHNVGTGDGIVQNGGQNSANELRTPPLWGMRTRNRLMHDGESLLRGDAILRHAGEATNVINNYRALTTTQKNQLITFLNSL